jgi:DNA-directed RNA polymerase
MLTTHEEMFCNIKNRQFSLNGLHSAYWLKEADVDFLIDFTYPHILSGIERQTSMVDIVATIGTRLRQKMHLPKESLKAVQGGWFVLCAYFDLDILKFFSKRLKGKNGKLSKNKTYQLAITNQTKFYGLLEVIDDEIPDMFPTREASVHWEGNPYHAETGRPMIRNAHPLAIEQINPDSMRYLTETLNKLGDVGWRINKFVYNTYKLCMESTSEETPFKHNKEIDPIKKASLLTEAEAVFSIASKNLDNTFYHLYNLDFRGRIYPNTAYLHEQGSDNAKGMIMLETPVNLGEHGLYWLSVHTANSWGEDKLELDDRVEFVMENLHDFINMARQPLLNKRWMTADKPFCFLACCNELAMAYDWVDGGGDMEEFPSCLPLYIDGSNNGVQHLTAMSLDDVVAPLVNLVPRKLPGDVYMFIAEHCINNVKVKAKELPLEEHLFFEEFWEKIVKLKAELSEYVFGTERHSKALSALKEYKNHNYDRKSKLWPIYWSKITNTKTWRKAVKRPVMTLGYGGTQYGMGEQINADTRGINDYLRDKEEGWAYSLGHLVYKTCYEELKGPAKLLTMFRSLAERENSKAKAIQYNSPVTNFPFVHKYLAAKTKRADLRYGDKLLKVRVQVWEETELDEKRQLSGAAPNIVHNVDATHLSTVVHDAGYDVTVVHDSFGCAAGNMEHMFLHVRRKFVELYQDDPLEYIMAQMGSLDLIPEKGKLKIEEIMESDFAFA